MPEAKISSKNQIVIPREAREALGLKAGDTILVIVRGSKVAFLEKPKSYRKALSGMAKGVYARDYLQKERETW